MPWSPVVTHDPDRASYWTTQSLVEGTVKTQAADGQPTCWRLQNRFTRTTPAGTREDIATCTFHITKNGGAGARARGLTSELAAIEAIVDVFWSWWSTQSSNQWTLSEYRWFNVGTNDPLSDAGYPLHGPPVRVTAKATAGTIATVRTPDQVANSITFITASRKHWGRIYVPAISRSLFDGVTGRLNSTTTDAMSLAARTMVNSLAAAAGGIYELGVYSPRGLAWLDTVKVQVDDVPDIIRRRRAKQASYRKVYTS